jgi:hypothetical protein
MNKSFASILKSIEASPLSRSLGKAGRLAHSLGFKDLDRWCRLELGGYLASNPAMSEDIVVPEYRTVVGQHAEIYGRILMLPSDLSFVNETRLRNGVEELEALVGSRHTVVIHDPHTCDLIREHLQVEVYSFRFSSVNLRGIISAIRMELVDKIQKLKTYEGIESTTLPQKNEDILELRPNIYGIGINLRALWKRFISSK